MRLNSNNLTGTATMITIEMKIEKLFEEALEIHNPQTEQDSDSAKEYIATYLDWNEAEALTLTAQQIIDKLFV
jgi:hypothetical protein